MRQLLLISILLIGSIKMYASHAAGMDISYKCISQGTSSNNYIFTVKFYRVCGATGSNKPVDITYISSCDQGSATLILDGGITEINPNCPTECNSGNAIGIKEYTYTAEIELPHCSTNYTISVCVSARNNNITTIDYNNGINNIDLCVQAELKNDAVYCNTSPTFSEYPTPFICAGDYYCYNNGATELDGDSLVYSLITPLKDYNGDTVEYVLPYSATNPVGGGSSFDATTGNICITPPNSIIGILAIKVEEYRNGQFIGSIIRDIQIIAQPCVTTPPALTGIDTNTIVDINDINSYTAELSCTGSGGNINFDINTINNNPNNTDAYVNMSWNNSIAGANFFVTNNNSMNPVGTFNWTPTIADIAASPYFFTVNISNSACPLPGNFSFQYKIILDSIGVSISSATNSPSCFGLNNGSINTIPSAISTPYTYSWSNGQSTQNISSLTAGTYSLTFTDNFGCISNETYTLVNPAPFYPIINSTNISCFGLNDGVIEVINEPISTTYLWSNTSTTSSINNLPPGNYSVDVTDSAGCVATQFFNITQPDEIIVLPNYNNISCYGANDGNIDLNISGGVYEYIVNLPPYSQVLSNGVTNYYSQSVLSPGTYNYLITDSIGCTASDSIIITEPSQLTASPVISNVLCKDQTNGAINLNTNGGTSPYSESVSGNNNLLQLSAGFYTYTITDDNLCLISDTFSISEPDSLISFATSIDATCAGYFDGTANVLITGGTIPYNTNWNGSNPNGLNAGIHNYTITDNNGCTSQGNVTINEPPGMQVIIDTFRVSCYGGTDGSAILNISGGGGTPYDVNWGLLDPNYLPAGNHIVIISDNNNCSLTDTVFITQPTDIETNPLITNVSCVGDTNGSCYLQLTGGVPPYNQTWFGIDSSYLAPGNYTYQVTDANNCIKNGNITVYEPDTLKVEASITEVNCFGENNGSVSLDITGGTAPFTTNFGTFNQYSLAAGTYNYTITDTNGCQLDSFAIINEPDEIFLNNFLATSPICRYDKSTLSFNISNAVYNNYTISVLDSIVKTFVIDTNGLLVPEGTPITLNPNFSGKVKIISLTDPAGCTQIFNDSVHIEVKQLPQLTINENDICIGTLSYTLNKATPSGGTYYINNIMTNYFDVENLPLGNYNITYEYTDPLTLCYNEITEIVTISDAPKAGMTFSPQPTDIDNPDILFSDNSNEEVLTSEWNLGDGTIIYNTSSFWHTYTDTGTYTIRYYITNMYGCTDSITNKITINPIYSIFIPTAFTPNDDGNNDYFYPSVIGSNRYNMKIYNRWGGIIYNQDNDKWDGKISDNIITSGIYPYSISVFDFNDRLFIYNGIVNLIK